MEQKKCIVCGTLFVKKYQSKKVWSKAKYCNPKCSGVAWRGHKPPKSAFKKDHATWNKGLHIKNNDCLSNWRDKGGGVGKNHPNWKGDKAKYGAVHMWVSANKKKPLKCEHCDQEKSYTLHWANKDHKYKRNLDDYMALCAKCHKRYDLDNGLVNH